MIKLHLPYPPSGWDLYNGWGKTRRLSPTYKPFALHVALKRQNMRQDIDNRSKAILDCLQHYGVIKNDNLCERLTMCWDSDLPAECVVIIQVCEEGMAA